jgi:hypothetical protein
VGKVHGLAFVANAGGISFFYNAVCPVSDKVNACFAAFYVRVADMITTHPNLTRLATMTDSETLTLRATVIGGIRRADDYQVIWRGMSIGRIMRGAGAPHDKPQWSWSCHLHGRPQGSDDRGNGVGLGDAKAKFRDAWARIRASLTDQDIADARKIAEASAEALARYDARR